MAVFSFSGSSVLACSLAALPGICPDLRQVVHSQLLLRREAMRCGKLAGREEKKEMRSGRGEGGEKGGRRDGRRDGRREKGGGEGERVRG